MIKIEQLGQIFEGWKNLIFEDPEVEKVALPRLEICAKCPIRTNGICDSTKSINGTKGCGCPLKAKVRSLNSKCPRGLW